MAQDAVITTVKMRYGIIGNAPELINAISRAVIVASSDFSTLIIGESGAGKEFFPKIIHDNSIRRHNKYIAVNCGAIPEGTIDSELFGHEKGAFTGADKMHKGYFEETDKGTIFLDEVGELPLSTQARLLRVLESGEFMRMGSTEIRKTDVRVVAATNRDLLRMVQEGRFREDLYYRISTVVINVPPLRRRGTDILLLAKKFLMDAAQKNRSAEVQIADSAKQLMLSYEWPGNVRQLKNVFDQISLFEAGNVVTDTIVRQYLPKYHQEGIVGTNESTFNYSHDREIIFNSVMKLSSDLHVVRKELQTIKAALGLDRHDAEMPPQLPEHRLLSASADSSAETLHEPAHEANVIDVSVEDEHSAPAPSLNVRANEKELIKQALLANKGNRKATAEQLGISERTLYRKIEKYHLDS